jgi:hypothetical protein
MLGTGLTVKKKKVTAWVGREVGRWALIFFTRDKDTDSGRNRWSNRIKERKEGGGG